MHFKRPPQVFPESAVLPILVGITGHRDLAADDVPELERAVAGVLAELRRRFPHTPVEVMSALAEGADQLAARAALQQGCRLYVPLPLAQPEYEREFTKTDEADEFRRLLAQADEVCELPVVACRDADDAAYFRRQYAQLGAFIARHAHLLIALWDGRPDRGTGGTSDVVRYMLEGVPQGLVPVETRFSDRETGPVYHIRARRRADAALPGGEPAVTVLYPQSAGSESVRESIEGRILQRIDLLNRDIRELGERLLSSGGPAEFSGLAAADGSPLPAGIVRLFDRYAAVDALAIRFQRRTWQSLTGLLGLSFCAVLALQLHWDLARGWQYLAAYAVSLGLAFGLYYWMERRQWQNRYLDYRAIAEGLRVQAFWQIAGLTDCAADYYLRRHRDVLEWIRNSVRTAWLMDVGPPPPSPAEVPGGVALVLTWWIDHQGGYFDRTSQRQQRANERLFAAAKLLLLSSVAIAGLKFWVGAGVLFVIAFAAVPTLAALLLVYANKRALAEQANQYRRMRLLFAEAGSRLRALHEAGEAAAARLLIFEAGREALSESADWLILHRERPLDGPQWG